MKKFITILISCSLALAASAIAQQDEQQQKQKKEKAPPAKSHPANAAKPAPQQQSAPKEHAYPDTKAPGHEKGVPKQQTGEAISKPHVETKAPGHEKAVPKSQTGEAQPDAVTKVPGKEPGNANVSRDQIQQHKKQQGAPNEPANANRPPGPAPAGATEESRAAGGAQTNVPNAQANPNAGGNRLNAQAKKPDPQTIQKIKTEHANFRAQPRPDRVPPVTFNQGYRIRGSEQWQGPQYNVFRSYHPERHDQGWYRSHFNRIELIGGGYYYWNNGYWYPAWGYDPSAEYYAYDAPIYVGHSAEPPDKVIAEVQSALQEMGYYQGEVDGLLGPLTRQALAAYQADHGLYTTEVIDEPTLQSLGMA
jgi:hypothetical protein